jgi:hypothetical protein
MSDKVFDVMEGYPERFPVIDFYLDNCHLYEIYGVKAENMHLIDVGKLDTLELAERFLNEL